MGKKIRLDNAINYKENKHKNQSKKLHPSFLVFQ